MQPHMPSPSASGALAAPRRRIRPAALLAAAALPWAALCAPLPSATDLNAATPDANTRHGLCHHGRCVLVDGTGKVLAALPFTAVSTFTAGLAVFDSAQGNGVIDTDGNVVLQGRFASLEVHGNGLIQAPVSDYGGEVSYYDRTGRRVRHFAAADTALRHYPRSWGDFPTLTQCRDEACTTSVLGADGRTVATFASLRPLEGYDLAAASEDGRHHGVIDPQLGWHGRRDYTYIHATDNVVIADRNAGRTLLDAQGRELLPPGNYRKVSRLDTGLLMAERTGFAGCLYFTAQGTPLPARSPSCVTDGGTALGYHLHASDQGMYAATLEGAPLSPTVVALLFPLTRRSVVPIAINGRTKPHDQKIGTITPQGKPQLPRRYRELAPYRLDGSNEVMRDDLLLARVKAGAGLVDLRGRWRIAPRHAPITPISHSLVAVQRDDGRWQVLDTAGAATGATSADRPERVRLRDGTHGVVLESGGHSGILGDDGQWRVPARYAHITITTGGDVLAYHDTCPGKVAAHLFDLDRQATAAGPALRTLRRREDGLLEGRAAADNTLHLLTPAGRFLANLPGAPRTEAEIHEDLNTALTFSARCDAREPERAQSPEAAP